nr:MAG TPA: protein of unknown function (DUF4165) [Caudoviricetes sp.]
MNLPINRRIKRRNGRAYYGKEVTLYGQKDGI